MAGRSFPPDPTLPLAEEPSWPDVAAGRPVLVVADAPTKLERRLVRAWIQRHRPDGVQSDLLFLLPSRRRRPGHKTDPAVSARLQRGDDPWVLPIRVVWRATERNGNRSASWIDMSQRVQVRASSVSSHL